MSDEQPPGPRRIPSTIGGALFLLMLLVTLAGVALTAVADWRLGVRVVAGSLLAIAALRCFMPERQAGMLAVRGRGADVTLLTVLGVLLLLLAASIPDQPSLPVP